MIRLFRLTAAVAALGVLGGCGLGTQSGPQPILPPAGAALRTPTPESTTTSSGRVSEYLYFVKDNTVVRLTRHVTGPPLAEEVVNDLLAGPNDIESARGYTSALLGDSVVATVRITAGQAVVALTAPVADTARNDEVLAYAQLVCTLTALPQIGGVTFSNNGRPVAVPRGDGSLSKIIDGLPEPLTAADYTDLISQ